MLDLPFLEGASAGLDGLEEFLAVDHFKDEVDTALGLVYLEEPDHVAVVLYPPHEGHLLIQGDLSPVIALELPGFAETRESWPCLSI